MNQSPPKKAILTLPCGNKIPVTILGFDGQQYKLAADFLANTNWFDKSQVQVIN